MRWSKVFSELGFKIFVEGVDRLFTYWCATKKPNGREYGIGDGSTDWQGRVVDENMASRTVFRREFGLPDRPPATSFFFPDAGQAFFRSDWTPSATYVTFDATRWFGAHNHLGCNGITLHAHGHSLLIDSGSLTYHFAHAATINPHLLNELAGPYRKSTRVHNTLSLNGWNQWTVNPDQTRHWHARGIDVMFSRYSGGYWSGSYGWWFSQGGGVGIPAVHDRIMIWLRDRCVVVIDTMMRWNEVQEGVSEAVRSPAPEMNWQFTPDDVLIDDASKCVTTNHPDGNVLMLLPHLPPNAQFALHHGSTELFRG